jgi:hypothetical protein
MRVSVIKFLAPSLLFVLLLLNLPIFVYVSCNQRQQEGCAEGDDRVAAQTRWNVSQREHQKSRQQA